MAKLPAKLSISKVQTNRDDPHICISITDANSGITFSAVEVSLIEFADAITGLARVSCTHETRNTEYLGKYYVSEPRTITVPHLGYNKEAYKEWLLNNAQEEGWIIDSYLGSQGSVTYKDGNAVLNYHVFKYVDKIDSKE